MIFAHVVCLLVLVAAGEVPALAEPAEFKLRELPKEFPEPWGAPPPVDPFKFAQTWNMTGLGTGGFVESVNKEGITLHWPEREIRLLRHHPLTGELLEEKKRTYPAIPAKKFLLGAELAKGEYLKSATSAHTYRITDVCVGDLVDIGYDRRNGIDFCQTINIVGRPKGDVPPAPGEKPEEFRKHHEALKAAREWRENRVPPPPKFCPTYLGKDGRFYYGTYPSETTLIIPLKPALPEKK